MLYHAVRWRRRLLAGTNNSDFLVVRPERRALFAAPLEGVDHVPREHVVLQNIRDAYAVVVRADLAPQCAVDGPRRIQRDIDAARARQVDPDAKNGKGRRYNSKPEVVAALTEASA